MDDDKKYSTDGFTAKGVEPGAAKGKSAGGGKKDARASRAKNQTVMLSPEFTGQVRALLNEASGQEGSDPLNQLLSTSDWSKPTDAPAGNGGAANGGKSAQKTQQKAAAKPPKKQQAPAPQPPAPAPAPAPEPVVKSNSSFWLAGQSKESKVVGCLVSYDKSDNGEFCELHTGRWFISDKPTPDSTTLVIDDSSVSQLHAVLRISSNGRIDVLDQLSESGTAIIRAGSTEEESVMGGVCSVKNGDSLKVGNRIFHVCVVQSE